MKKNVGIIIAIALGLSALLLTIAFQAGWVQAKPFTMFTRGPAPAVISYQGQIFNGKDPYIGKGYFKFQVMSADGSTQYWSNDGKEPPDAAVILDVVNGLFSINLGDINIPGMSVAIDANTFSEPNALLRVWFSPDGSEPWTVMPDQVIASVPYALQAQQAISADSAGVAASAGNADTVDGSHGSAFQKDITGTCPAGYAIKEVSDNGNLTCTEIPKAPSFSISELYPTGGETIEMAIGSDGLGVIAYQEYIGMTASRLVVIHCADINCTSRDSQVEIASDVAPEPRQFSLVIGKNGYPMIAYTTYVGDLKIANCSDAKCQQAITTGTLDSGLDSYRYPSLAIGRGGWDMASFVNDTTDKLMLVQCTNSLCTGFTTPAVIDDNLDGYPIMDTEMIISDFGGNPTIAYSLQSGPGTYIIRVHSYEGKEVIASSATSPQIDLAISPGFKPLVAFQHNRLWLSYCWTPGCSDDSLSIIDDDALSGASISIGTDGLPLISYMSFNSLGPNNVLKVARCNDPYCSVIFKYRLDDSSDSEGDTAIVIGMDGLPLVAYFGTQPSDELVALHCSNRYCNE